MSLDLAGSLAPTVLAGALAAAGGLLVPTLVRAIPEPTPDPEPEPDQPAKTPYAALADRPGLAARSALIGALVGCLLGAVLERDVSLLWLVPLTPVAIALSVIDWHTRLLPRLVVIPATLAAIVVVVAVGLLADHREEMVRALIAMVATRSFFWLLWWLRSAGMGFGDVRLAAPVGLVLGWAGWGAVVVGVWIGFVIFAVPALVLALLKRDRSLLKQSYPYGPFLLGGALIGLAWGTALAGGIWG